MKKIYYLLLGVSPTLMPFSKNAIDMIAINDDKFQISVDECNVDDWNEKYIVIDFSIMTTTQNSGFRTFDLEIEKGITIDRNGKKEIIINWKYYSDDKWSKIHNEGIKWNHKGFWIGEMINDFFKDNQIMLFKNLVRGERFGYDIQQPDAMMAQLFMIVFKLHFSTLTVNYTSPGWFIAITSIGGFSTSAKDTPKYMKLRKTREGRHELNLNYFTTNKEDQREIMEKCFDFIFYSNIFSKYNIEDLWHKNWIKL
ncbi:hypothetical protein [Williamsoniiplasma luminosum]|uniref:Uncharacterized protein n=1 Tax=Williamsoniiplasma luminosum TaxID=214888 RepID=A0A2S0NJA3_9MOLU|nr:hypothetical protein [Williamsoniiplasma luminosum]AVP49094.1 MAG: hypothetical protein C5T88_00645 [Williamsoniiplasma luminosum]